MATGTELVEAEDIEPQGPSRALADLRTSAMSTDPEQMMIALADYDLRRKTFRDWLRGKLIEGVHFGYPPGCEPKGNVNAKQWVSKPSLYQCGADFIIDLMLLRPMFEPDPSAWEMAGSVKGYFFYKCELFSKSTGELVGEGRGASKVAQRRDENGALKMAMKCAKVAAVLNAYGLSDLFTQDLENPPDKEEHDTPAKRNDAAKTQPRGKRVSPKDIGDVMVRYRTWITNETYVAPTPEDLAAFASKCTGVDFTVDTVRKSEHWTQETLKKFSDEVAKHEPPDGI